MSQTVKALILAIFATPILYGLGSAAVEVSGFRASYIDGRLILGLSFFISFSVAHFFIRR